MNLQRYFISLMLLLFSITGAFAQNCPVEITVVGITEIKGSVFLAVYENESNFNQPENAFRKLIQKIDASKVTCTIDNLPEGNYAIALFQDENNNEKLDRTRLGFPKEKYGFSNNARRKFSAPTFLESTIDISCNQRITISIK